jgi:hypothetical protein
MAAITQLNPGTIIGPRYGDFGGKGYREWQSSIAITRAALWTRVTVFWIADTNGYAEVCLCELTGWLWKVVTVPDPVYPPSANYDVTLVDEYARDILDGLCLNRNASQPEDQPIYQALSASWQTLLPKYARAKLLIQNAGGQTAGRVVLCLLSDAALASVQRARQVFV